MSQGRRLIRPRVIIIYSPEKIGVLNLGEIADYLAYLSGQAKIEERENFFSFILSRIDPGQRDEFIAGLAKDLAGTRVKNILQSDFFPPPLYGEIRFEEERIQEPGSKTPGILYDGFRLQELFWNLLPREEANLRYMHIIFTEQLIGSWDEGDLRYHARTSIYGFPNILSLTGLVEAPAKPREYYLLKQQIPQAALDDIALLSLKEQFKGRFLDYQDARTTEVMKGYVAQAFFNHTSGFPFCSDKSCRLFNAHWQEELIQAQINSYYEFCPSHQELLKEIREIP
jgi:hypothetical protein